MIRLWAVRRAQIHRRVSVLLPLESEQDLLKVRYIEDEVRRATVAETVQVSPRGMCTGTRSTLDGQEERLSICRVDDTVGRSEAWRRGQVTCADPNDVSKIASPRPHDRADLERIREQDCIRGGPEFIARAPDDFAVPEVCELVNKADPC